MAEITGADVTARALHRLGVDTIFYIIGGPITPIAEATEKLGIRMIDVRHEQAAAMAAHAYSRLMQRPGVCLTPSGPATANAMPGVMNALADASPVIAIGGSTALYQRGMGGFQEMDQVAMMAPACKLSIQATITSRIGEQLGMLYRRAMEGSKGPVYLDLPADIIANKVDEEKVPLPSEPYTESRPQGDPRRRRRRHRAAEERREAGRRLRQRRDLVGRLRGAEGLRRRHRHPLLHHAPGPGRHSRRPRPLLQRGPLPCLPRGRRRPRRGHAGELHPDLLPPAAVESRPPSSSPSILIPTRSTTTSAPRSASPPTRRRRWRSSRRRPRPPACRWHATQSGCARSRPNTPPTKSGTTAPGTRTPSPSIPCG